MCIYSNIIKQFSRWLSQTFSPLNIYSSCCFALTFITCKVNFSLALNIHTIVSFLHSSVTIYPQHSGIMHSYFIAKFQRTKLMKFYCDPKLSQHLKEPTWPLDESYIISDSMFVYQTDKYIGELKYLAC